MLRPLVLALVLAASLPGCFSSRLNDRALHPSSAFELTPEDLRLHYEIVTVEADGAVLHGWVFPAPGSRDTVLLFSGNSGNKQLMLPMVRDFLNAGYNAALFDHRGFGLSTGDPDLWSLLPDARAVVASLRARPDTRGLAVFGVSLGSAVALGVAAAEPDAVDAVVVEGLFDPYEKLAQAIGGFVSSLCGFFLVPSGWDVGEHVVELDRPVLFVHGADDGITSRASAARLFAAASKAQAPRDYWIAAAAGHAPDIAGRYPAEYAAHVARFLDEHLRGKPGAPVFRARWTHTGSDDEGVLEVTLEHAGETRPASRVPVEIAVLYEDDETAAAFHRVWFGRGFAPTVRFASSARPTFVGARVPGCRVREVDGGWVRDSRYQHQREAFDTHERSLHGKLGFGVLRILGTTVLIDIAAEKPPEERLAACREVERELRGIVTDDLLPRIRSRYAGIYGTLGEQFEKLGCKNEALAAYERSLTLVPSDVFGRWWFDAAWWSFGTDLEGMASTLERMAKLASPEAAADYRRRAGQWRERLAERSRRITAWFARQRARPPTRTPPEKGLQPSQSPQSDS